MTLKSKSLSTGFSTIPAWVVAAFLFLLVSLSFLPTLDFEFINYDDPNFITENPNVNTGVSLTNIKWAFASPGEVNLWNPLTYLSHQLDVSLFGLNPSRHHAVNVFWHALATTFLFLLARNLTKSNGWSVFIAILWAVHPEKVQSVAWISERKDVLSGALFFASLYLFSEWKLRSHKNPLLYLASLGVFFLAGLAKPSVIPLPFILLVLFYLKPGRLFRSLRSSFLPLAPFLVTSILVSGVVIYFQSQGTLSEVGRDLSFGERISQIVLSYIFYPFRFLWPVPSQLWFAPPDSRIPLMGALALLAVIIPTIILLGKKEPLIPLGALIYTLLWLPVSGIIPLSHFFVADRYSYLPQVGIILTLVGLAKHFCPGHQKRVLLPLTLCLLTVVHFLLLQKQLPIWKSNETLFSHEMRVNPTSFLAPLHYGEIYRDSDPEKALHYYSLAHLNDPEAGHALTRMGQMQVRLQRPREALENFQKATRVTMPTPATWTELLMLQVELKLYDDAEQTIAGSLDRYPGNWSFLMNGGNFYLLVRKNPNKALPLFLKAHALAPNDPGVSQACAECYRALGQEDKALMFQL